MPHVDWQHLLAMAIVAAAAWYIALRLWRQALAFRRRPPRRRPGAGPSKPAAPTSSPLIQIQTRPPVHLKRPPSDDQ